MKKREYKEYRIEFTVNGTSHLQYVNATSKEGAVKRIKKYHGGKHKSVKITKIEETGW